MPKTLQRLLLFVIALLSCSALSLRAEKNPEQYDYRERTVFHIDEEERNGKRCYTLESESTCAVTFLAEEATRQRSFSISENSFAAVSNIKASLDGEQIASKLISDSYSEQRDIFISDYKHWTIELPHKAHVQSVFEYSYKRTYKALEFMPLIVVPNRQSLSAFEIVFEHPSSVLIDLEPFFAAGKIDYSVSREKDRTVVKVAGLHQRLEKPYYPFDYCHAVFLVRVVANGVQQNPTSVEAFVRWYNTLLPPNNDPGELGYDSLRSYLQGVASHREKLRSIYDFVRRSVRYIADETSYGAIVPRLPAFVLEKRYGDCKDKAFCLAQLARKYGIPVAMALVSTEPEVNYQGTHLNLFNHAICYAEIDGEQLFLDPTSTHCEFGNLPECDIENHSLILSGEGSRLVESIASPEQKASCEVSILVASDNVKAGTASIILRNQLLWSALNANEESSASNLKHYLSFLNSSQFHKIDFDDFVVQHIEQNEMRLSAKCDLSRFIIQSPTKTYIPPTPIRFLESDILERAADSLGIYCDQRTNCSLIIDLQDLTAKVESKELRLGSKNSGVSYEATMSRLNESTIRFRYKLTQYKKHFTSRYQSSFIDFCRQYFDLKKNLFSITRN